jgi:hypothetical protein
MKLELIIIIIIIIMSYYNYNYCKRENEREKERNMERGIICIDQCSPSQVASMLAQPLVQEKSCQQ